MALDRDLGVAVARAALPADRPARGWEPTAATGVRGLRLLHESGRFVRFELTERDPVGFAVLARNAARYPGAAPVLGDGRHPPVGPPVDYVDLDPYGSPVPFLPAAVAALAPRGWLAVTATDLMVLAGAQPHVTERKYGARPVRGRLGPEAGLRILIAYVVRCAAERGRSLAPRLGYVGGHYLRAYFEAVTTPGPDRSGLVDPARWDGPDLGARGPFGPLWLGPLLDPALVDRLRVPDPAARPAEAARLLQRWREEARVDAPFYYEANVVARALRLDRPPPLGELLAALRAAGYGAARTHARPEGFRTTAPRREVERIVAAQSQNARVRA